MCLVDALCSVSVCVFPCRVFSAPVLVPDLLGPVSSVLPASVWLSVKSPELALVCTQALQQAVKE